MTLLKNPDADALERIRNWGEKPDDSEKQAESTEQKPADETAETTEEAKTETTETKPEETNTEETTEKTSETIEEKKPEETLVEFVPDPELFKEFAEEGQEFKTKAEFNAHILEGAKKLKAEAEKVIEIGKKLTDLGKEAPEFLALVTALANGKNGLEAIVESGIVDLIPKEGDYDFEAYKKILANKKEENRKSEEYLEGINRNIDQSNKTIADFKAEHKLGDDFGQRMVDVTTDFSNGIIKKDVLDLFRKGMAYDAKIKELEEKAKTERAQGVIEGKNAKYDAAKDRKNSDVEIPDVQNRSTTKEPEKTDESEKKFREKITKSVIRF